MLAKSSLGSQWDFVGITYRNLGSLDSYVTKQPTPASVTAPENCVTHGSGKAVPARLASSPGSSICLYNLREDPRESWDFLVVSRLFLPIHLPQGDTQPGGTAAHPSLPRTLDGTQILLLLFKFASVTVCNNTAKYEC